MAKFSEIKLSDIASDESVKYADFIGHDVQEVYELLKDKRICEFTVLDLENIAPLFLSVAVLSQCKLENKEGLLAANCLDVIIHIYYYKK